MKWDENIMMMGTDRRLTGERRREEGREKSSSSPAGHDQSYKMLLEL